MVEQATNLDLTEHDLAEIVESAVSVMLGLDPGVRCHDAEPCTCEIGAIVHFSGEWNGAVVVSCDERFGRDAAAAMFGLEPDDVAGDDLADALGEVANMVAGNAKPLVAASAISLPTVVRGCDVHVSVPGAEIRIGIKYVRDPGAFSVRLFERVGEWEDGAP